MPFYSQVVNLDIENSSICNAKCPQCLRETFPNDYSWFNQTYLSEEFFDRIPNEVYDGLQKILFSGTMGDPCTAPNFIEVIKKVRRKNYKTLIKISTNGGMKNPAFWIQLAEILGSNSEVIFAIDGLSDTNHIYRMNVNYEKVIQNASAFINAGGNASWQFIAFKHNEHQIEEAKQIAYRMGFNNFFIVTSHRFGIETVLGKQRIGGDGVLIEPPTKDKFKHKVMLQPLKKLDVQEWLNNSEDKPIDCYAKHDRSLYIDSQGNVFPCCFLGASLYSRVTLDIKDGWDKLYSEHKQNLYIAEWDTIINSSLFNEIQNSWDGRKYSEGRIATCAANCGDFEGRLNYPTQFDKVLEKSND
jgi:MoaA/NifB/PqqE/SkfB family radical SAM enzyme